MSKRNKKKCTDKVDPWATHDECERCGSTDNVKLQPNPYASTICGDDTKHMLCEDCVAEFAENI